MLSSGRGGVSSRRQVEWEAASSLIEGICLTLQRQPIISFLPHLRSLINVCVNLVRTTHIGRRASDSPVEWALLLMCVSSGDGRGRPLQCGRRPSSAPPEPLPVAAAALQHGGGATGGPADPGKAAPQSGTQIMCILMCLFHFFFFFLQNPLL